MTSSKLAIAYEQLGAGPPVVLLHPSGFGPALMRPFADDLATDHRVIIPHRRGYGMSAEAPLAPTLDRHHQDLADLIDVLRLERPTIVGTSAGATLALGFARHEPDRDVFVVAHEPLVGPLAPSLHSRVTVRIERLLAQGDEPHETSLFMSELVGVGTWNHLRPAWREAVETNRSVARQEASMFATFALDADELDALGARSVVTTVGSRSGPFRQEAATVLDAHGITSHDVAEAGHLPIVERTHPYAQLVRSLMDARTMQQWIPAAAREEHR
jgi:pimeloyl-ACP methyl ester carboxylesterase